MNSSDSRPGGAPSSSPIVAWIVAAAFFMENLDGTIIATALPNIAQSYGIGTIQASIGITSYLLTLAIFIPASGWAADRFGTRTVFCGALGLFTLSSVACGLAPDFYSFVAARILQGAAAALMSPVGRLAVLRSIDKSELMRATAITTWPGLLAPVIGPPLGGFITTYADWRWIFFLNIPLGIAGLVMGFRYIANFRHERKVPFDAKGFTLTGLGLSMLMYGLDRIGANAWVEAGLFIAGGIVLGTLAIRHARRARHPLVELSSMKVPTFAATVWGGLLFRMAVGATPVLLPLMFQEGFGMTAFASGMLVLAYAMGNLGMKPFTNAILRWYGFRNVMLVDGVLSGLFIFACGMLSADTPILVSIPILIAAGATRSMSLTCLFTLPYVDIQPHQRTGATTLMSVVQQVGWGFGVAFGTVALQASLLMRHGGGGTPDVFDFRVAFVAVALIGLLSLIDAARLPAHAGAEVSGHKPRQA